MIAAIVAAILIPVGLIQNWQAATYAEVFSSFAVALSIVFLVIDKVAFDKPYFTIADYRIENNDAKLKSLDVKILIQNDGFRDANAVRVDYRILNKEHSITKKALSPLRLITDNGKQADAIGVRVGDQFEVTVSVTSESYQSSKIRIRYLSAFTRGTDYFSLEQKNDKWELKYLPPFFAVSAELKYLKKNVGIRRYLLYGTRAAI